MRVKEIIAWQVRIPLKKPIQHASHTRTETDNIVIRVTLDDGTEGFGEGVPREYVTGETIDSAISCYKIATCRRSSMTAAISPGLSAWRNGCASRRSQAMNAAAKEMLRAAPSNWRSWMPMANTFASRSRPLRCGAPRISMHCANAFATPARSRRRRLEGRFAAWKMWVYGFAQLR